MKKVTGLAGMLLVAGVAVALGYVTTGFGKSATASTVTARVSGFTARTLSVYNAGTNETVFALVNSTTNEFNTRLAAGTTVPIPHGASFSFDTGGSSSIDSVCYATTNGTAAVLIGAF
jgi:hypothetical protein